MKQYVRTILIILLSLLMISTSILANNEETTRTDDAVERTVDYLNKLNDQYTINEDLKLMALNHSKYMYFNEQFTSIEENGLLYYRGRTVRDRATTYNYGKSYIYEFINKSNKTYLEGIEAIINNPYSRGLLFDPLYTEIGMNSHEGYYTFIVAGQQRSGETTMVYPLNKQENVPIVWENNFGLNPYSSLSYDKTAFGLPITFSLYSDSKKVQKTTVKNIQVTEKESGKKIATEILLPETDRNLSNSIVILPLEAYKSNTTYEVIIDINFDSNPHYYKGEFTTARQNSMTTNKVLLTRGEAIKKLINIEKLSLNRIEPFRLKFTDINIKSDLGMYINTAYEYGIIRGISETQFGPNLNMTYEQAYAILVRAYEIKYGTIILVENDKRLNQFSDRHLISSWAHNTIYKAVKINLVDITNKQLTPTTHITEEKFNELLAIFTSLL